MKQFAILGMILLSLSACSSSDNDEGSPVNPPDNGNGDSGDAVSYSANIRPIIQANCLNCHSDPPSNNAPMPLTTYALVRDAAENRNLLNRINSTQNPMPPGGRLPQASRDLIQRWIEQNYPE